jgi:hypothetical protein
MEAFYNPNNAGVERAFLQTLSCDHNFCIILRLTFSFSNLRLLASVNQRVTAAPDLGNSKCGEPGAARHTGFFFTLARVKIVPCSEGKTRQRLKGFS